MAKILRNLKIRQKAAFLLQRTCIFLHSMSSVFVSANRSAYVYNQNTSTCTDIPMIFNRLPCTRTCLAVN